jgi:CheY-like chemotaxis protein
MRPTGRVLIVDDDAAFLEAYRDELGSEGFDVRTATDRASALARLDEADWDVVLLDQKLQGVTGPDEGLTLLAEARVRAPAARSIIVTAYADPDAIKRAFAEGAYDYLDKDGRFFSVLLRSKVSNAIELVRERRLGALGDEARERHINETWAAARTEKDAHRKGRLLEELLVLILSTVEGFTRVDSRVRNDIEEIDVVVRNESADPFWSKEGVYILVECKNWSKPVDRAEYDAFRRKLERRSKRCRLGFFVSLGGLTQGFRKAVAIDAKDDLLIVPMAEADLARLVEPGDRSAVLKDLHQKATVARNNGNGS